MEHSLDTWQAVKKTSPNTFIVGRYYVDDGDQVFADDPEGRAEKLFALMKPAADKMRGVYDAWMGYNESVVNSPEDAQALSRFYVRWGDLMRAAGLGSCAYSFATGNPELNLWQYLADGVRHCDLLSLHEYSAPTLDNLQTWLCLRYRRAMDALPADARRPIVITETGIDGGAGPVNKPQDGWSKFTDAAGYVATLQWYDNEIQKDNYVIGATIFAMNGWGNAGSFGMGDIAQIRDYIAQGGSPLPASIKLPMAAPPAPPKPATPPTPQPSAPAAPPKPATPPAPPQSSTPTVPPKPATPPAEPGTPPTTCTVQSGDTLYAIARKFGVTVAALSAANNISNPSLIKPGQVLTIPKS